MRVFFAIPISWSTRLLVSEYVKEIKKEVQHNITWFGADNYHITVRFIGEIPVSDVNKLAHACHDVLKKHLSFSMKTHEIVLLPSRGNPRTLALTFKPEDRLLMLARSVGLVAKQIGIPEDPRPFRAHLTLARLRSHTPVNLDFGDPQPIICTVDQIVLYESRFDRGGVMYVPLERLHLNKFDTYPEVCEGDHYGTQRANL